MDSDSDSSVDYEEQMQDLEQLSAALKYDSGVLDTDTLQNSSQLIVKPSISSNQELIKIEAALALNNVVDEKYKRLEKILSDRLRECRQKLKENVKDMASLTQKVEPFRYYSCGKPYFKDKNNIAAPDNEDTILMKKSNMYDFSNVLSVPGWTIRDKSLLINLLHEMSVQIRRQQLNSKIASLKREKNKDNKKEISQLQREISGLKKKSLAELALPIEEDYDWDAVTQTLHRRHSAQEYKALWKLFFHPSINKSSWSRAEHQNLNKLASANNMQDWDDIASKLNTGRTGYQCFVYFRTNTTNGSAGRKWTKEEVEYLKRLVDFYREDNYIPWGKVASAIENRTKIQVYNKYQRMIEQRKGRFLEEEDSVILNFVHVFGPDFKRMAEYLPGRSVIQLRTRYNILSKMRLSITWSIEDDKKLLQIMANQESSTNFSMATKHFPGKDRIHIRTRYTTLQRWIKNHPLSDISQAPRRAARRLLHGQANIDLKKSIEALKNRMQCEVNKNKKKNRLCKLSTESEIDDAIMETLYSEVLKEQAEKHAALPQKELNPVANVQRDQSLLNTTNLKFVLIFLNSALNKNKVMMSTLTKQYPGLTEDVDGTNLLKVKSYSKKETVRNIELEERPDIWGYRKLGSLKYVLPPNLSTMTGCRMLLNHVGSKFGNRKIHEYINLPMMARHNSNLKHEFTLLKERFKTLFLWPILLSNKSPLNDGKSVDANPDSDSGPYFDFSDEQAEEININTPGTSKDYRPTVSRDNESESDSAQEDMDID